MTRAARATVRATLDGDVLLEFVRNCRFAPALCCVSKGVCRVAEDCRSERNKVEEFEPHLATFLERTLPNALQRARMIHAVQLDARAMTKDARQSFTDAVLTGKVDAAKRIGAAVTLCELQRLDEERVVESRVDYNGLWHAMWKGPSGPARVIAFSRQRDPGRVCDCCTSIRDECNPVFLLPIAHVLVDSYEASGDVVMTAHFALMTRFTNIVIAMYRPRCTRPRCTRPRCTRPWRTRPR